MLALLPFPSACVNAHAGGKLELITVVLYRNYPYIARSLPLSMADEFELNLIFEQNIRLRRRSSRHQTRHPCYLRVRHVAVHHQQGQ